MAVLRAETMYFAHDVAAAVRHWRDVLGLTLIEEEDWGFAMFEVAGHPVGILQRGMWNQDGLSPDDLPAPRLSLWVDDLEAEVARLKAAGADVDEVTGEPGTMRGVDLRDAEGNWIFLWEAPADE